MIDVLLIVVPLPMLLQCLRINPVEDVFSMTYLIHGAVGNQDELIGLQRRLVLQYAVFGDAKLYNPAPIALRPPTAIAPSRASMNQPTSGPATINGPMPGIKKNAESNNNPDVQPQNAPNFPQYFIRSPAL
jgi:hypothetical protein